MIEQSRMQGGQALSNALRGSRRGGSPWHVILDADGKELINSTGPKGNVGCPAAPHEIDYFMVMLDKTRAHMSDDDRKVIERDLRIYGKQLTTRRNRTPGYAEYAKAIKSVKIWPLRRRRRGARFSLCEGLSASALPQRQEPMGSTRRP